MLTPRQALEALVLRCPTEISSAIDAIVQRTLQLVKYDPVSTFCACTESFRC